MEAAENFIINAHSMKLRWTESIDMDKIFLKIDISVERNEICIIPNLYVVLI